MPPILVVDDEPEIVILLPEVPTHKADEVEIVSGTDSSEALLTLQLPCMNGCEVLRRLRRIDEAAASRPPPQFRMTNQSRDRSASTS